MNFIDRFIKALLGLKPRKRTIFDDIEDARRKIGLNPPKPPSNRWY